MKKLILFPIALLLTTKFCYSQDTSLNRVASFKNYGQHIQFYLKTQHELIYKGELDTIKEQFIFMVSFKIDVNGKVVEYKSDLQDDIPMVVVNYIKKVIYSTSGSWHPEIKNCRIVKSDKILCRVNIYPKNFFINKLKADYELKLEDLKVFKVPILNFNEPNRCYLDLNY
jgi:hypothetical protein